MSDVIAKYGSDLAETPEGKAWVFKSLHPANQHLDTRGIPDESSCPTVMIQYNTVARITPPPDPLHVAATWGFDLTMVPDVIEHASVGTVDDVGNAQLSGIMNSALKSPGNANTSYVDRLRNFQGQGVEAHRLVYYSATVYQDGPALANQGTLCATQFEVSPREYASGEIGSMMVRSKWASAYLPLLRFQTSDLASYDDSQTMPNAYFSESKHGCYLAMKLGQPSHKWTTDANLHQHAAQDDATNQWTPAPNGSWYGLNAESQAAGFLPDGQPPYPDVTPAYRITSEAGASQHGDPLFTPLNNVFGAISVRGVSVQTSFAIYFRMGIECRVQPGTLLAPQQRVSPPFDPKALMSYFRVSRELKDAYPASYNDLGTLWRELKSAISEALPLLHPGLAPFARLFKSPPKPKAKPKGRKQPKGRKRTEGRGSTESAASSARSTAKVNKKLQRSLV